MLQRLKFARHSKPRRLMVAAAGIVLVCVIAVGLTFGLRQAPYECTIADIGSITKIGIDLWAEISMQRIALNDTVSIFVDIDHKPSDEEVQQLEQIVVKLYKGLWTPHADNSSSGFYLAECIAEDLCKFRDLDFVTRVEWAESPLQLSKNEVIELVDNY